MLYPETFPLDSFPEVDDLVLAYLAGVIDCDGFITINRSKRKGVVYHGPVIGISGTRPDPHRLAASIYGGKVSSYTPKNSSHRTQYQWQRMGKAAIPAICQIYPYLRIKHEQAFLAVELFDHIQIGKSDDPFPWFGPDYNPKEASERLTREMRSLNQSRKKAAGRILDGRTWEEFPQMEAARRR